MTGHTYFRIRACLDLARDNLKVARVMALESDVDPDSASYARMSIALAHESALEAFNFWCENEDSICPDATTKYLTESQNGSKE